MINLDTVRDVLKDNEHKLVPGARHTSRESFNNKTLRAASPSYFSKKDSTRAYIEQCVEVDLSYLNHTMGVEKNLRLVDNANGNCLQFNLRRDSAFEIEIRVYVEYLEDPDDGELNVLFMDAVS